MVGDTAVVVVIDADHIVLALEAVHADRADAAGFDAVDERTGVDERAARTVDDDNAGLHLLDGLCVDHVIGAVIEERVQRDDIRLGIQRFERNVLHAHLLHLLRRIRVVRDDAAAEAGQVADNGLADAAGADNADSQVLHLHAARRAGSAERIVRRVRAEHDVARLANAHQHEHDRIVGNRIRRVARVRYAQTEALCSLEVYVVKADGTQRYIAHTVLGQLFQHRRGQVAGADTGNAGAAAGQMHVFERKVLFLKGEIHVQRLAEVIEERAFVRTGVECHNFHFDYSLIHS